MPIFHQCFTPTLSSGFALNEILCGKQLQMFCSYQASWFPMIKITQTATGRNHHPREQSLSAANETTFRFRRSEKPAQDAGTVLKMIERGAKGALIQALAK
jgi:hypothetical protein